MKKNLIILLFLAIILIPLNVFATSITNYSYSRDYTIDSYDINLVVNENNTFNITEKIGAYFNVSKHGIFRKIPLKNEVVRLDGTKSNNRAKINDIKVSDKYTTYNENGNKVIKIGDPNKTLTGAKNYTINYSYNIGKDTGKEYDELYFNLIGNEWDTTISNVSFTITMPKSFDQSKLGFSSGNKYSTMSSNVSYTVSGNVITGYYFGTLNPGEGITVRLELPEGYFTGASNNFDSMMLISLFLPIAFVIICFLLWKKYGKDDEVIETVEFYPPEDFNSAEIGYIYKGQADDTDITSLLIYLANKGYIKISETEEKSMFSKTKGFKITKIKEYDGNNINEKLFLKGLFSRKATTMTFAQLKSIMKGIPIQEDENTSSSVDEVTAIDLYNNFYITMGMIKTNLNNKENKYKIFEKTSTGKGLFVAIMILMTFILITVKPILEYGEAELIIPGLLFPGIGFSILFTMVFGKTSGPIYVNGRPTNSAAVRIIFGLVFGLIFGGVPWAFIVLPSLLAETLYLLIYIIGLTCIASMITFLKIMPKRTPYGNEMLGKIKGFRNFLETAEKGRLEALVMDDPEYFYNILPYTYVLGVSDKWIKKFETIALQAPNWYSGSDTFSAVTFGSFMASTISSASSAMSSSPSSSGGSSGGGSSGGGSGGGGGGSW